MNLSKRALSIFLLLICMFAFNSYGVIAKENAWIDLPKKSGVSTDKSLTVTLPEKFTNDNVESVSVEKLKCKEFAAVKIEILKTQDNNMIDITPVASYDNDTEYCVKIYMNDGKRYKMSFTTQKKNKVITNFYDFQKEHPIWEDKNKYSSEYFNSLNVYVRQKKYLLKNGIHFPNNSNSEISYLLDKKYKKLTGYYAMEDSDNNDSDSLGSLISIYGDGQILLEENPQRGEKAVYFEIDLTGVDKLQFMGGKYYDSTIYEETGEYQYYHGGVLLDLKLEQ